MKTNKQEEKNKVSLNSMDGTNKLLDFLSLSVKGLKIVDTPTEFERNYNLEWNMKRAFTAYYGENHIKDEQQETFFSFCDAIKFDMDIWRDYCGITENRSSKGIVYNSDGNIEYADGINYLQIYQTEKYGDDDFPYLQLLKHDNIVQLLADSTIYENLGTIALREINDLGEYELSFAENKLREIENDFPENFINKVQRAWYITTLSAINKLKSSIQGELFSKKRDLKSKKRDLKSFVYLIYHVFLHAGFEVNKGTSFSEYLALILCEKKITIDDYIKDAAKDNLPLWKEEDRKTQRLVATLMHIKTFSPKEDTKNSLFKSICQKFPKKESLQLLTSDEKALYDDVRRYFM